jgi:DNA-binding NarL/FixJ family response regulator
MARIRVLIADAHPASLAGIRSVLEQDSLEVCAEAHDAASAIEAAVRERPSVCLLDAQMPGGGITAAAEIVRRVPGTLVVLLTSTRGDSELFDAVRAGAVGLLPKDTNPARLAFALRGVVNGEAALPRTLITPLMQEVRESAPGRYRVSAADGTEVELTPRERDVFELLLKELPTEEMAARLGISSVTVRTHVSALLKKLNVPDRASVRRLARR